MSPKTSGIALKFFTITNIDIRIYREDKIGTNFSATLPTDFIPPMITRKQTIAVKDAIIRGFKENVDDIAETPEAD